MSKYRVVPDSVIGRPCVVVYDGDTPIITIWHDEKSIRHAARYFSSLTPEDAGELADLVRTVKALQGSPQQLQGAIEAYLRDKLNEVYFKEATD